VSRKLCLLFIMSKIMMMMVMVMVVMVVMMVVVVVVVMMMMMMMMMMNAIPCQLVGMSAISCMFCSAKNQFNMSIDGGGIRCLFVCLFLFVMLWNDEVCDNGNAMKQCNFQNNYGVIT